MPDDFLSQARAKYGPAVANMGDRELAAMLHKAIAPDVPFNVFASRNGIRIEKPGMLGAVVRSGLQGATANFSDELRGLGAAIVSGGDTYSSAVEKERTALKEARAAYPKSTLAAEMAGGLSTALLPAANIARASKGVSYAANLGRAAKLGAAEGVVFGAGGGEGVQGRALGAGLGAVLGGVAAPAVAGTVALGGGLGRTAKNLVTGGDPDAEVRRTATRFLSRESPDAFVGQSPEEGLRAMARTADPDKPLAELTYGTRRMLRGSMAINHPQAGATRRMLDDRAANAADDAVDAMRVATGASEVDEMAVARELLERKRANAHGAYDAAYAKGAVADDEINRQLLILRDEKTLTSRIGTAWEEVLAESDITARQAGLSPSSGRDRALIAMDANGAVLLNPQYATVRNLDHLKRTLDNVVGGLYREGKGGLAGAVKSIRTNIVKRLDDVVPEYKTARLRFAGDLEAERAFADGLKATNWSVNRLADYAAQLDDVSREMFQTAYFTKELEKALSRRGGIVQHFRDPRVLPRLRAVFGKELDRLDEMVQKATTARETVSFAEAGSRTMPVSDDMDVVAGARSLVPGVNLAAGLHGAAARNVLGNIATRPAIREGRGAAMADLLMKMQPEGLLSMAGQAERDALNTAARRRVQMMSSGLGGYFGGQTGGLLGR